MSLHRPGLHRWFTSDPVSSGTVNTNSAFDPELSTQSIANTNFVLDNMFDQHQTQAEMLNGEKGLPGNSDILHAIQKQTSLMNDKFQTVFMQLDDVTNQLLGMKKQVEATEKRCDIMEVQVKNIENDNVSLKKEVFGLKERVNSLEYDTRRKNMVLLGIPETPNENDGGNLIKNVRKVMAESFKIGTPNGTEDDDVILDQVIRCKGGVPGRKPILLKFALETDKSRVFQAIRNTEGNHHYKAKNDICKRWRDVRKKLSRFYNKAVAEKRSVKVVQDYIIVDDVKYDYVASADSLTPKLK